MSLAKQISAIRKLLDNLVGDSDDKRPIYKAVDLEKKLVTGVVMEPEIFDAHDDIISDIAIEDTAFEFMELYQTIGKQHSEKADAVPVESFIAREDMFIGDEFVFKALGL